MTEPLQSGVPRRLRQSTGDGRYSIDVEQASGPIFLVRERGYADDDAGVGAVSLLEGLLNAVQKDPRFDRIHFCTDYSAYKGSSTATRMAMIKRVVTHPALGCTAFYGAPWHTRTAVALLRAVFPQLEARYFPSRERALAYLEGIVDRDGWEPTPPPGSLLDEILDAGLRRSALVMLRLREGRNTRQLFIAGASRPSIEPPGWSWTSDDQATRVDYSLVEDVVLARLEGPVDDAVLDICAQVEAQMMVELGQVRLSAIYATGAAEPAWLARPIRREGEGRFARAVVTGDGPGLEVGRRLAMASGSGGPVPVEPDLDRAWLLTRDLQAQSELLRRSRTLPEDPDRLRALALRQQEVLLLMKDSQERLFESIARVAWHETREDELSDTVPGDMHQEDSFWALQGALHLMRQDIAEMLADKDKQAEELARASRVAELASRAKSHFLGVVSHELRTPLNAISGLSALLARSEELGPVEHARVDGIRTASSRLERLVEDLLDFTRLEAGALRLAPEPFDLSAMLSELRTTFSPRTMGCGVALETPTPAGDLRRTGDRGRLIQVLSNLLDNGLKFTDQGSVRLTITLDDADALFEVRDTGRGIRPEDAERVFKRFEQTRPRAGEVIPGVGLGLNIARHLVRLMGGELEMQSQVGEGTTFRFGIPLPRAERDAEAWSPSEQLPDWSGARILVVEDDRLSRVVARGLLEHLGCQVHCAEDGERGVQAWTESSFDLVLMDCQMPRMNGFEATRNIRDRGGRTPIVAMTAHALEADRARAKAAGMDEFLVKPVHSEALSSVLERHLPSDLRRGPGTEAPRGLAGIGPARAAELFEAGAPALLTRLRRALLDDDRAEASVVAHRLLGQAACLDAPELADACRPLAVQGPWPDDPGGRIERIAARVDQVMDKLRDQVERAARGAGSPPARGQLLVVDDDPLVLELISNVLTSLGYRVESTSEADEAMRLFVQSPGRFDALVLDQRLDGTTGLDLLEAMRRHRPEVPALICSGEELPPGELVGRTGFALKPIPGRELDRRLQLLIDRPV